MTTHARFARPAPLLIGLLAVVPLGAPAGAQPAEAARDTAEVEVGDRVRVTTDRAPRPVVGWIESTAGDGLVLVDEDRHEARAIPAAAIRRLEVSRVRRSGSEQATPGMIAGGLGGLALGVALTEEQSCEPDSFLCFDYPDKLMAGLMGASLGVLVGGLVSAAIVPAESWADVSSPRVVVSGSGRGASVALRLPVPAGRPR